MVLMIFCTKYFNFFGDIINSITNAIAHSRPVPALQILMPLGISYYTLMGISYIVDVYRKTAKPEKNPLMLMLFPLLLPRISFEGPFDRYDLALCSQLESAASHRLSTGSKTAGYVSSGDFSRSSSSLTEPD